MERIKIMHVPCDPKTYRNTYFHTKLQLCAYHTDTLRQQQSWKFQLSDMVAVLTCQRSALLLGWQWRRYKQTQTASYTTAETAAQPWTHTVFDNENRWSLTDLHIYYIILCVCVYTSSCVRVCGSTYDSQRSILGFLNLSFETGSFTGIRGSLVMLAGRPTRSTSQSWDYKCMTPHLIFLCRYWGSN